MVPNHAFELLVYARDGKIQFREFQNLETALAAANALRPSSVRSWRLSVVLEVKFLNTTVEINASEGVLKKVVP